MERKAEIVVRTAGDKGDAERQVAAYLPSNYRVTGVSVERVTTHANGHVVTVEGEDSAGWTLDGYVLPRLASGLYFGKEI